MQQCAVLSNFKSKNVVGVILILLLRNSGQQELSLHNMNAKCKSNLLHTDVDQQYLFKYW